MKKLLNILGKLAVLAIFLLAVWLLYHKLRSYSLTEIKYNLAQIPNSWLLISFVLMILNYCVLIGYDWLALKAIHKKLGMSRVCLVSFVGCVISYNFGALLGGSTVRYRLYSAWGFTPLDIVRLVIMLAVTFWVGAMGLAGLIFIFAPPDIPPELGISTHHIRPLGGVLLGFCMAYLALCAVIKGRPFQILGKEFALPTLPIATAQTLVAGLDLVVAASCLYALLPHDAGVSFLEFLPNYLLAQVTVVLTHVPGGVGVLEVIIMNLTPEIPTQRVFAAILAFRVIYYLIPLLAAAVLLGLYELYLHRSKASDSLKEDALGWLHAWMPTLMSYAVFLAGSILCLSAVIPVHPRYIMTLVPYIPLPVLEGAHMFTGLAGVLLLVLAYGIQRRKLIAWRLTMAALAMGIVSNLCKGVDWPEALMLLMVLFPLWASRDGFWRISPLWRGTYPIQWIVAVGLVVGCNLVLGLYLAGLPKDSEVFLSAAYMGDGPRILRTLAAEVSLLFALVLIYLRAKIRPKA